MYMYAICVCYSWESFSNSYPQTDFFLNLIIKKETRMLITLFAEEVCNVIT